MTTYGFLVPSQIVTEHIERMREEGIVVEVTDGNVVVAQSFSMRNILVRDEKDGYSDNFARAVAFTIEKAIEVTGLRRVRGVSMTPSIGHESRFDVTVFVE